MEKLRRSVGKLFFAGKPYRAMVQKIYREMLGVMAKSFLIILAIRVLGYQKIGQFSDRIADAAQRLQLVGSPVALFYVYPLQY